MRCIAAVLLLVVTLGGCSSEKPSTSTPQPSSSGQKAQTGTSSGTGHVEQQPGDFETLSKIFEVKAWRFQFHGGPVKCWLEIEEVGQDTMPERIPARRALESSELTGDIVFALRHVRGGGRLLLQCGDRSKRHDIRNDQFIYHWNASEVSNTPTQGNLQRSLDEGKEVTLVSITAREFSADSDETPRKVTMKLQVMRVPSDENSQGSDS